MILNTHPPKIPPSWSERGFSLFLSGFLWGYGGLLIVRWVLLHYILLLLETFRFVDSDQLLSWGINSRQPELSSSQLSAVFLASACVGIVVGLRHPDNLGSWLVNCWRQANKGEKGRKNIAFRGRMIRRETTILMFLTLITALAMVKVDISKLLDSQGLSGVGRLSSQMLCGFPGMGVVLSWFGKQTCTNIEFSYLLEATSKLVESLFSALLATAIAAPISFFLAFFAARNLTNDHRGLRYLYRAERFILNAIRAIEPLIWATILAVWLGIGPFAGMLALMVHSVASLTKQYSETIEGVLQGPLDALKSVGARRVAVAWFAVVPQVTIPYLAVTAYRWDINVRMATVIGLVGGGGIGNLLIQEIGLANWQKVGALTFLICVVICLLDSLSSRIRILLQ